MHRSSANVIPNCCARHRLLQVCVYERAVRGVRRPLPQQPLAADAGDAVHGRPQGPRRALPRHVVHQDSRRVRRHGRVHHGARLRAGLGHRHHRHRDRAHVALRPLLLQRQVRARLPAELQRRRRMQPLLAGARAGAGAAAGAAAGPPAGAPQLARGSSLWVGQAHTS